MRETSWIFCYISNGKNLRCAGFRWEVRTVYNFATAKKKRSIINIFLIGAIVQQILLLPHHATNPTPPHPFTITHVFLTGTNTTPLRRKDIIQKLGSVSPPKQMSKEGRKEIVRPFIEANLDKSWLADVKNRERFDVLLERFIIGR
jgi:hypothetical protein